MHGGHATQAITIANLAGLILLAVAGAAASRSRAPADSVETVAPPRVTEDDATIAAIRKLMEMTRAYRDADLNLDRLARKLAIPARQISNAINRATGNNVSRYVNDFRIAEACRLITATDKSVTEIMLEVGFQTKSNFNREFRRVTDMTPLAWRATTKAK